MKSNEKNRAPRRMRRFFRDEDGSYTIEFVIWIPIFAILLAIVMNLSMVFYYESQMLRVAQDATRAYSMGRFENNDGNDPVVLAEEYITANLSFVGATFTVDVVDDGANVNATVTSNAAELMPFSLMSAPFAAINVGIVSQYIIEY